MELKLAPMNIGETAKKVKVEDLIQDELKIVYFDKENSHKDLQKAKSFLESKGKVVYMGEVHYGLDVKDFIYEFRII